MNRSTKLAPQNGSCQASRAKASRAEVLRGHPGHCGTRSGSYSHPRRDRNPDFWRAVSVPIQNGMQVGFPPCLRCGIYTCRTWQALASAEQRCLRFEGIFARLQSNRAALCQLKALLRKSALGGNGGGVPPRVVLQQAVAWISAGLQQHSDPR